jgi:hypothetical protein
MDKIADEYVKYEKDKEANQLVHLVNSSPAWKRSDIEGWKASL